MKNLLRRWLGYNKIEDDLKAIKQTLIDLQNDLVLPLNAVATTLLDENSKTRKRLSDRLADKAIRTMTDESKARRHTLGEL